MSRYTEAVCRLCRREGMKLMLKGDRCNSVKCAVDRRKGLLPGQHTKQMSRKTSEYGKRLREKQRLRRMAGIGELQLRRYFAAAKRLSGVAGENLLRLLEMRLDNVVYRLGFAPSRAFARQLVSHKHVLRNGRTCNIASTGVRVGDKIRLDDAMLKNVFVRKRLERQTLPSWLSYDAENQIGEVVALPQRQEMSYPVNESLIVEFYSK